MNNKEIVRLSQDSLLELKIDLAEDLPDYQYTDAMKGVKRHHARLVENLIDDSLLDRFKESRPMNLYECVAVCVTVLSVCLTVGSAVQALSGTVDNYLKNQLPVCKQLEN